MGAMVYAWGSANAYTRAAAFPETPREPLARGVSHTQTPSALALTYLETSAHGAEGQTTAEVGMADVATEEHPLDWHIFSVRDVLALLGGVRQAKVRDPLRAAEDALLDLIDSDG